MRHLMICISGWAGSGKDECAGRLVKAHGAIHTGLADPGKRHLKDAYGFTDNQLWGPSEFRNAGDTRYPKPIVETVGLRAWDGPLPEDMMDVKDGKDNSYIGITKDKLWYSAAVRNILGTPFLRKPHQFLRSGEENIRFFVREGDPDFWLSPREALQQYMELMNTLYADTWIRKGIDDHRAISSGEYTYLKSIGIKKKDAVFETELSSITCFSDFRHIHEHRYAREVANRSFVPVLLRIKRPNVTKPPFDHRSETEQTRIRDAAYDFVINNDSTLEDLYRITDSIVDICSDPEWSGKSWRSEYVLPEILETYHP